MNSALLTATILSSAGYGNQVLATNPIAYWKLNEGSGSTIVDSSGNGYDGAYTGVTWDGTVHPTGTQVPYWDGANDYGDLYSAGLASAFDFDEGSVLIWVQVDSASVWTDSTARQLYIFKRDGSNFNSVVKTTTDNQLQVQIQGVNKNSLSISRADWFSCFVSWSLSADAVRFFIDNVEQGSASTGILASSGSGLLSNQTTLGALNTTPANPHHGYLAHAAVWDRVLSDSERALVTTI